MKHALTSSLLLLGVTLTTSAHAEGHGTQSDAFPSHTFTERARRWENPQLNIHFGVSQPTLLDGFNMATDIRVGRFVLEYSHGANLSYSKSKTVADSFDLPDDLDVASPWTTGFGVGYTLVDELYVMAEFKGHHYDLSFHGDQADYTTVSIGPALAWRFFIWKGLNATAYLRYWPNVWDSENGKAIKLSGSGETITHKPIDLGLFANVSIGWAFDL